MRGSFSKDRLTSPELHLTDSKHSPVFPELPFHIGGMMPLTPAAIRVAVIVPSSPRTAGMKTPPPRLSTGRSPRTVFTTGGPGGTNTLALPSLYFKVRLCPRDLSAG